MEAPAAPLDYTSTGLFLFSAVAGTHRGAGGGAGGGAHDESQGMSGCCKTSAHLGAAGGRSGAVKQMDGGDGRMEGRGGRSGRVAAAADGGVVC